MRRYRTVPESMKTCREIAKFKIDGMYDMFRAWKTFVGTALEHADLT